MRVTLQAHRLWAWTPFFWSPSAHFLFHGNRNSYFFIGWKCCDKLLMYLSSFLSFSKEKTKKQHKTNVALALVLPLYQCAPCVWKGRVVVPVYRKVSKWSLIKDVCLQSFIEKKRKDQVSLWWIPDHWGIEETAAEWNVCTCACPGASVTRRWAGFVPVIKGNLWSRDD